MALLLLSLSACRDKNYVVQSGDHLVVGSENRPVDVDLDAVFGVSSSGWAITLPPQGGSAAIQSHLLHYVPNNGWVGVDSVVVARGTDDRRFVLSIAIEPFDDFPSFTGLPGATTATHDYPAHLSFEVRDVDTPIESVVVSASSGDVGLVPPSGLVLSGSGNHYDLAIIPVAGAVAGTVTVTVAATDGNSTRSHPIVVTIALPPSAPMIVTSAPRGGPSEAGCFTGFDPLAGVAHAIEDFPGLPSVEPQSSVLDDSFDPDATTWVAAAPAGPFYGIAITGGAMGRGAIVRVDPLSLDTEILWTFTHERAMGNPVFAFGKLFFAVKFDPDGLLSTEQRKIVAYSPSTRALELVANLTTGENLPVGWAGRPNLNRGLVRLSTGRILMTTSGSGGSIISFDPSRPGGLGANPYDFVLHDNNLTSQDLSNSKLNCIAATPTEGRAFCGGVGLLSELDGGNGYAYDSFRLSDMSTFGQPSTCSVAVSPGAGLVAYVLPQVNGADGKFITVDQSLHVREMYTFSNANADGYPAEIAAMGNYDFVGISVNENSSGTAPSTIWTTDAYIASPVVQYSTAVGMRLCGLGAGDGFAMAWSYMALATSGHASFVVYDKARREARTRDTWYPRGRSPGGGMALHPNGSLYGVNTSGNNIPSASYLSLGGSPVHQVTRWDPLSGQLSTVALPSVNEGGIAITYNQAGLRPVVHAGTGDLYVLANVRSASVIPSVQTRIYRISPDPLACVEFTRVAPGSLDVTDFQGGSFSASEPDMLYFFGGKLLYKKDVTGAPGANSTSVASFTERPLGRPLIVGTKAYGVAPTGHLGHGAIYSCDLQSSAVAIEHEFAGDGSEGIDPTTSLIQAADGKLYGVSQSSGGGGFVFSCDPNGAIFAIVATIAGTQGATPKGELLQRADGSLWGLATQIGDDSETAAVMFSVDLAGPTVTLHPMSREQGFGNPFPELVEAAVANQLRVN